jgi:uncharacterized phage infection (PIP) family protein YhgE
MLAEAMMTPEEQFMKIENALRHSAEIQARHAEQIEENRSAIRDIMIAIGKLTDSQQRLADSNQDLSEWHQALVESHVGLVDSQQRLVDAHLGVVDSQQRLVDAHLGVLDSQKLIEETLGALARAQAEEQKARKRANEGFDAKFSALLQAQIETENKLQRWIDRQGHA